ncbi:MAG: N-acetyltransferase [Bacteroidales bacterium]|jgi:predicted N-acetyltransferase YhbS|nr:N-acetyltransferase [Bacteroidales bacterium]
MNIVIRQETKDDYQPVFELIEKAFINEVHSDHKEQFIVERLRKSDAFIPELSLLAQIDGKVVGYILLTKIQIRNDKQSFDSLALAPVAVLPEYQKKDIAGQLIETTHKKAKTLGHKSIVLLGHKDYYPKFGYIQTDRFGIKLPFDVPKENCLTIELEDNGLTGVNGTVVYAREFNE